MFPVATALLMFILAPAYAAPPDAGQILREQRQAPVTLPDRLQQPEEKTPERLPLTDTGVKVTVREFRFTGINGIATPAELQELVKGSVGKELSMVELRLVAALVTDYLRQKGYLLARAYLPKQDVTEGVIEIAVIAGRLEGDATIRMKEPWRLREEVLKGYASRGSKSGTPLNNQQLERSLLLMNDLPGISARGALEQGSSPGSTRFVIEAQEGPMLSGLIAADNFGNRYTGVLRGTAQAAINDPLGLGDQMVISFVGAEKLAQWSASYALPLGNSGLRGEIAYTGLNYEIGKELSSLDADGQADTAMARIRYPWIRSRAFSLWQGLGYEFRYLEDRVAGNDTRERKLHIGATDLNASMYDTIGGGGLTNFRVAAAYGELDLTIATDAVADAAGPKAEGSYTKFNYSLSRLQHITKAVTLFASVSGQLSNNNLDSSEKFILGGPTGVRAYPVGEASGDEGHGMTLEARYDLPYKTSLGDVQLIGFYDAGKIRLHHETWTNSVVSATGENDYWLKGGGLGLNLSKAGRYAARASWSHTIDDNPGRSTSGRNADGQKDDSRFWLQMIVWL